MPTHIFTRLGLWEDSIDLNRRSAAAALGHSSGDEISLHHPHALDYLAYAYLQRAEDDRAEGILRAMERAEHPFQPGLATMYTLAAVPARFAVERQDWSGAARLEPRAPALYPWERFPAMEAITHFARGLGSARLGDLEAAAEAVSGLEALAAQSAATSAYWGTQVEIQRLSVQAWTAFHRQKPDEALAIMRRAAEMESATEKHPVTPGEVLPAAELLADMFLESGRYREAHSAYDAALKRSPNRYNSLYGAGLAAERLGDDETARAYYRRLVSQTAPASERPGLLHARRFLDGG